MAKMVQVSTNVGALKDILLNKHNAHEIGVQISNTGVSAGTDGRKIIPAGTPIGGTTSALEDRDVVLKVTNSSSDGANSQGILRYDVDVTNGNANGTMIVMGVVDSSKCPALDPTVKTALTHIIFQNGGIN